MLLWRESQTICAWGAEAEGTRGGSSGLSLLAGFWPVLATQGFQLEMSEDEGMQQAGKQGRDLG